MIYWIVGGILVLFVVAIVIYNKLVRAKNMVKEAWSGIDVQLKRRHDLIPAIVETVKGYSKHESGVFTEVANARAKLTGTDSGKQRSDAENNLTNSIRSVFALVENYPNLKADRNFLDLQKNLVEIEDNIQMARRYYNGSVRDYNILVESFPCNIAAGILGYRTAEFFEIELATQREAPELKI